MPAGFAGLEAQLWLWMVAMIRPGAAFLAAPVFGAAFVPVQLRLVVALANGIPALAVTDFTLPDAGLVSIEGFMLVLGEVLTAWQWVAVASVIVASAGSALTARPRSIAAESG